MASTMLPSRAAWPSASAYNPLIRKSGGLCPAGYSVLIFDWECNPGYLKPGIFATQDICNPGYLQPGMLRNTEAGFCDVIVVGGFVKAINAAVAVTSFRRNAE